MTISPQRPFGAIEPQPLFTHNSTESGDGTTATINEAKTFTNPCVALSVFNNGDDDFTITINDETNTHLVPSKKGWASGQMLVKQFVIKEEAAVYAYSGAVIA